MSAWLQSLRRTFCLESSQDFQQLQSFEEHSDDAEQHLVNREANVDNERNEDVKSKNDEVLDLSPELQDCLNQLANPENSTEDIKELLMRLCSCIPAETIRVELISRIFTHLRKTLVNSQVAFLQCIIRSAISEKERRKDLYDVLLYLPEAVFGDKQAQEQTRVFVNVLSDTRTAMRLQRKNAQKLFQPSTRYNELLDMLIRVILTNVTKRDSPLSQEELMILGHLANSLESPLAKNAIAFQQIILSGILAADPQKRKIELEALFSDDALEF